MAPLIVQLHIVQVSVVQEGILGLFHPDQTPEDSFWREAVPVQALRPEIFTGTPPNT